MFRTWYFKQNLQNKLSLILIGSILVMVGMLAIYVDSLLRSNYSDKAQERINYAFDRIKLNLDTLEKSLQKGITFINDNASFKASIELINTYQDKSNYDDILLDEEKKLIVESLLHNVKLSFNDSIALYDKNNELIAYVYKNGQRYILNFISYENGKPILYSKAEDQIDFNRLTFKDFSLIPYKHPAHNINKNNKEKGMVNYFTEGKTLIVNAHISQFDKKSGHLLSHVDITHRLGTDYFKSLSEDLNVKIMGSVFAPAQKSKISLLSDETVEITEDNRNYLGLKSIKTQNGLYYLHAQLDHAFDSSVLLKNRITFLLFIFIITIIVITLIKLFFKRDIAIPLEHIMNQIHKINHQDYSRSLVIQTGDEFELISNNINKLADRVKEREDTLIKLLELSPIAMRIARKQGNEVVYYNAAYTGLIETSNSLGISPKNYYANSNEYNEIITLLSQGNMIKDRLVELAINGSKKWALASYMPFIFKNEEVILGWFYDLTERKHLEQELAEREEHYRIIVNQVADAIAVIDVETLCFNDVNEAACKLLGYSSQELIGHPLSIIQEKQDDEALHRLILEIERAGQMYFENRHRCKDGHIIDVLVTSRVIYKQGKKYLIPAWHDITEQKRHQEFLEIMINSTHEGILILDDEAVCIRGNSTIVTMLGYTQEELIGKSFFEYVAAEDIELVKSSIEMDQTEPFETKLTCQDGSVIDVLLRERKLLLNGKNVRFVAIIDITKYNQAVRNSDASNRAKGEFLANMSHEIRTPLNGIIGFTDLTLKTDLTSQQTSYLSKAKQSSIGLLNVINDILDYSKIEAGKLSLEQIEFNIYEVMEHVSNLFEYQASEKNIALSVSIDPKIPEILIGDPLRISQILNNLVSNSIKFTKSGEVKVQIEHLWNDEERVGFKFLVNDTGIGITPQQQQQLFQPFSQADTSNTRNYGGTGLGLMISRQLVEMMNGDLKLESEYGKGSTFSFTLEFKYFKSKDESMSRIKNKLIGKRAKQYLFKSNTQVLLVEDNESNQFLAREYLESYGLNVMIANNGQEAVSMTKEKEYDLILMDLQMPVMDGFEATKHIREFNKKIPIIALSAAVMMEDKKLTHEAGMNEHIAKPIDPEILYEVLSHYLVLGSDEISTHNNSVTATLDTDTVYGIDMDQLRIKIKKADKRNQMLHAFADSHRNFITELTNEPAGSEKFKQLIHSLKGVSGNISLIDVYLITKKIEATTDELLRSKLVSKLQEELDKVIQSIDELVPQIMPVVSENYSKKSFIDSIDFFITALNRNEFMDDDAINPLIDQIQYFFDHDSAMKIKNDLVLFNYSSAKVFLEMLKGKLDE